LPTQREFQEWATGLRKNHPEMFGAGKPERRQKPRERWHPLLLRVYGVEPWDMGRYSIKETNMMWQSLEEHGLGL